MKPRKKNSNILSYTFFCGALVFASLSAYSQNTTHIATHQYSTTKENNQPSDVLTKLNETSDKIQKISKYMGIKLNKCSPYTVSSASPREVYFQALRFLQKINLLDSELSETENTNSAQLYLPDINIQPNDVYNKVDQANVVIDKIINDIKISNITKINKADKNTTPSDVYNNLLLNNQNINLLLDQKSSVADIYEISTLSMIYTGEIINTLKKQKHFLQENDHYKNKTLNDVITQQIEIINILKNIDKKVGLNMLSITTTTCKNIDATANDSLDLSYLILSEIAYIAQIKNISLKDVTTYYPGKKIPSEVYARNELLIRNLSSILKYVEKHPDWINRHDKSTQKN